MRRRSSSATELRVLTPGRAGSSVALAMAEGGVAMSSTQILVAVAKGRVAVAGAM